MRRYREEDNTYDPFTVAVKKSSTEVVGHMPKLVSAAASLFIRKGGNIMCIVTGRRKFSGDLPQGGLELPCNYIFSGSSEDIAKVKKLLQYSESQ